MSKKVLTVATAVQKAVLENVLLGEIATGFWKEARPADHAESWKGVEIEVGTTLGATGFDIPRNYNFVNPDFFKKAEAKLLEAAQTVEAEITTKSLKKQLIALNQILGNRLKEVGGAVEKLSRGRKATEPTEVKTTVKAESKTKKVAATFADPAPAADAAPVAGTETLVNAEQKETELEAA